MEENKRKVMSPHDVKQSQCSKSLPHVHAQRRNTTNFKVSSDVYSPGTTAVCRVCLAMNVRMYHISEHKLRVMYERVTGIEITSNDKLPQMLCWECVARLSSANRFVENASKTQEILLNMTNNDRYVTINYIKSIDRTKNQLESTLHTKYNINQFNLYIVEDNHVSKKYDNKLVSENNKNCEDNREVKFYEQNSKINIALYDEQCNSIEVGISDEKAPIKSEQEETNEILEVTDNSCITRVNGVDMKVEEYEIKSETAYSSNDDVTNIKDEDMSVEVAAERQNKTIQESNQMDKSSEMCEVIKQRWKKKYNSPTPLRKQRSKALSRCKNLILTSPDKGLSKCNTQDLNSSKLFVNAHSMKDVENEFHLPIEERITFEDKNKTFVKLTNKASKYKSTGTEKVNPGNTSHARTNASTSNDGNSYLMVNENESCSKLFLCDICDEPFHNKPSLTRHIRKHPKLYKCTYCSYKTYHKDLKEHMSVKHKKPSCDQSSTCKHINKDKKSIFYNCSYCSYKAYRKNDLSNHINTEHAKSKQISNTVFNCSYCSYKTYQKYDLCKHIDVNHSKIATFNCSYCIYTAYRKNQLDQHINARHTKSTVFNCPYCSFKAYNKSYLNKHVKDKHS